jgi:hypothetical protein
LPFLGPAGFFYLFIIFLMSIAVLYAIGRDMLENFRSNVKIENDKFLLPKTLKIEIGIVLLDYYQSGKNTIFKIDLVSRKFITTNAIDLNELCVDSFIIIQNRGYIHARAPSLRVINKKYEGAVILCLDPSKTPLRNIMLSIKDERFGDVFGEVSTSRGGFVGEIRWIHSSPRVHKMIYDEKSDVYRVVEEYV